MLTLFVTTLKSKSTSWYLFLFVIWILVASLILIIQGKRELLTGLLSLTLIVGSIPVWYGLLRDLSRGSFGVDIIAGVALIGTFIIGQYLAGVVVLLMLSGGQLFEEYAMNRAKRELSALLSRTPTFAHVRKGNTLEDIPIAKLLPGMIVVIKPGEVVSVDGTIIEGESSINESTLTGESLPIQKIVGSSVYSGTENMDNVIAVRVEKPAQETRYQAIIRLVTQAEKSKAPIVRLADTYSLYFTGITFLMGCFAWFLSHDIERVVSVLVVATPCPLLLATPIAIMSGMSTSSTRGIIVKDGGALEMLARIRTFVFDKTGTITLGTPEVTQVISFGRNSKEKVVTIAASLDQLSNHILSKALLSYAHSHRVVLEYPKEFKEHFGDGTEGMIEGKHYALGKKSFVEKFSNGKQKQKVEELYNETIKSGGLMIFLAEQTVIIGAIIFQDTLRNDAGKLFLALRNEGVKKTIILTGDKKERAETIASTLHVDKVVSECLPEDKMRNIKNVQRNGTRVAMIGDGINDAPALAKADVGIALGIHGETASSDVADIVILSRSIGRVYDVYHIAKKTIFLARQGILLGIGASTIAMVAGSFGYISPLFGTLLQEGIDVVVIMNALRLGSMLREK